MFERFTERARKAVVLAQHEAARLRHDPIGTEHLLLDHDHVGPEHVLLGLAGQTEGVAARVFSSLDVDADAVRREMIRRLPDEAEQAVEGEGWTLFRGRVTGVRGELAVPRSPTVTVDAGYSYRMPYRSRDASTVQVGDVLGAVRDGLREMEARSVEAAVGALGGRLLAAFPEMMEVTETISGVPDDPTGPTFSVSATIRR